MSSTLHIPLLILLFTLCGTGPLQAQEDKDSVLSTISEAVHQYKNGQFTDAVTSLNYASQIIRQKKGEAMSQLLPSPLEGWTAKDPTSQAMGASMFGGSTTAERHYIKNNAKLIIQYSTNSPMMQTMLMMFHNPAFAGFSGKFKIINGQKAIVNFKEGSGNITIAINNSLLITLEGKNIIQDDLIAYAKAIDYNSLRTFL